MKITRQQFDEILSTFNSQPKEYDYEYTLTTLVFGSQHELATKEVVQRMHQYAPEHDLFLSIVDKMLNVHHIDNKYKCL